MCISGYRMSIINNTQRALHCPVSEKKKKGWKSLQHCSLRFTDCHERIITDNYEMSACRADFKWEKLFGCALKHGKPLSAAMITDPEKDESRGSLE